MLIMEHHHVDQQCISFDLCVMGSCRDHRHHSQLELVVDTSTRDEFPPLSSFRLKTFNEDVANYVGSLVSERVHDVLCV